MPRPVQGTRAGMGGKLPRISSNRNPKRDGDKSKKKDPDTAINPLLLMPMRLEYRLVSAKKPPMVRDTSQIAEKVHELLEETGHDPNPEDLARLNEILEGMRAKLEENPPKIVPYEMKSETELWLRWYPDNNFSETGVAAPTPEELALIAEMEELPGFSRLPHNSAFEDPALEPLWLRFAAQVGPERAAHLIRTRNEPDNPDWADRIGRICGLPGRIGVFAYDGRRPIEIGRGGKIPANTVSAIGHVSYGVAAMDQITWFSDFNLAEKLGMGLRITDPAKIEIAQRTEWLVALGLSEASGETELSVLFEDRIANGSAAILSPGEPTNNSPTETTDFTEGQSDATDTLANAFDLENGAFQIEGLAADRLADAVGLKRDLLRKMRGGANASQNHFAAMLRVVGPILLDDRLDGVTLLDGVDEHDFIDLIADTVSATGALPSLRMGDNAYGIVAVTDLEGLDVDLLKQGEAELARFMTKYNGEMADYLETEARERSLRLLPEDPDAAENLGFILTNYPGARRLDVTTNRQRVPRALGCPYVTGSGPEHAPQSYLRLLRTSALDDPSLPDPDATDRKWPLLYRLARMSRERVTVFEAVKPSLTSLGTTRLNFGQISNLDRFGSSGVNLRAQVAGLRAIRLSQVHTVQTVPGVPPVRLERFKTLSARFSDALHQLSALAARPDGNALLERMMLDVVDLFQYRLDAWVNAIAVMMLGRQREKQEAPGLHLGYFGMIGRLRDATENTRPPEYVQAPSLGQARTAAVLRSAHLRHAAEGPFAVRLTPARLRLALLVVDYLRQGIALSETLGLLGERLLRDTDNSDRIAGLRNEFPIENVDPEGKGKAGPSGRRLFDGLAFVETSKPGSGPLRILYERLSDALDAFSDLVMTEAVHLRAMGAAEAANAWLQVLSGGPIPDRPVSMRTHRPGHASDHRLSLLLPKGAPSGELAPMAMVDPDIEAMLRGAVPDIIGRTIRVQINDAATGNERFIADVEVGKEFALSLLSLCLDPLSRVQSRLLMHLLARKPNLTKVLGIELSGTQNPVEALRTAPGLIIDYHVRDLDESLEEFVSRLEPLRKVLLDSRALNPEDMSAGAAPEFPLDEDAAVAAVNQAIADFKPRLSALRMHISALRDRLVKDIKGFNPSALRGDSGSERVVRRLYQNLVRIADLLPGQPEVIGAFGSIRSDYPDAEAALRTIRKLLDTHVAVIDARLAEITAPASDSLSDARAALRDLRSDLHVVLGRKELPCLPRFTHSQETRPLISTTSGVTDGLEEWPRLRRKLRPLLILEQLLPNARLHEVAAEASADDNEDRDPRDEQSSPRSYHFGKFITFDGVEIADPLYAGLVLDEWVEMRPSTIQPAAIALNYDSPQAEAPNAMICCVPPSTKLEAWTEEAGARAVREVIRWMQVRATTTQNTPLIATVLPGSNEIRFDRRDGQWVARLPQSNRTVLNRDPHLVAGAFATRANGAAGLRAARLNEIGGFSRKRRG